MGSVSKYACIFCGVVSLAKILRSVGERSVRILSAYINLSIYKKRNPLGLHHIGSGCVCRCGAQRAAGEERSWPCQGSHETCKVMSLVGPFSLPPDSGSRKESLNHRV